MSKYNKIISVILIVALISSFFVLLFVFGYSKKFCGLLEETIVTIFTGCVFAIPTGLVVLFFEHNKVIKKKSRIVFSISQELNNFSEINNEQFSLEKLKKHNEQIILLYEDLNGFLYSNHFNDWKKVSKLKDNIFEYSLDISCLMNFYNSTNDTTINSWLDKIKTKGEECLEIIKEISK